MPAWNLRHGCLLLGLVLLTRPGQAQPLPDEAPQAPEQAQPAPDEAPEQTQPLPEEAPDEALPTREADAPAALPPPDPAPASPDEQVAQSPPGRPAAEPSSPDPPLPVAVPEDAEAGDQTGWVGFPIAMYTPETHLGLGGMLVHYFSLDKEPSTRPSSVALVGMITTRGQQILELHPDLYLHHEDWRFWNKLDFLHFPDSFWGVGPDAPASAEERYIRTRVHWRADWRRRIAGQLFAGLRGDLMHQTLQLPGGDRFLGFDDVPGMQGGLSFGLGPLLTYDSRDLTTDTNRGTLIDAAVVRFDRRIGSDYQFTQFIVDARHFIPLLPGHTLALRAHLELQRGNPPFYLMAQLGAELLRGYYFGRYRDKNMLVLGSEYRFPLLWRFSAVVFAGAGQVADRPTAILTSPIRWAVGSGLRFALSTEQRLNLRIDAGVGPGSSAVYLSASEAF